MRKRIEQLEMNLADSKDESEQLNQRLSTTLSRINILKTTNQVRISVLIFSFLSNSSILQRLINECDKLKHDYTTQSVSPRQENRRNDSASSDGGENIDSLHARLKNTSFDASRQRKLNKTLQTDNEALTKNLQSLTDKYNRQSIKKRAHFSFYYL
jgi:hypothetical protein